MWDLGNRDPTQERAMDQTRGAQVLGEERKELKGYLLCSTVTRHST